MQIKKFRNEFSLMLLVVGLVGCSHRQSDTEKIKDSVDFIAKSMAASKPEPVSAQKILCDSVPADYFLEIKFPFGHLDSIDDQFLYRHQQLLAFTDCDRFIFDYKYQDGQDYYKYICLQDTGNYYTVILNKHTSERSGIKIYSIDKTYKIIDSQFLIESPGDDGDGPKNNVLINGRIVNEVNRKQNVIFSKDGFTTIAKVFYTLEDTITHKKVTEIGMQAISTCNLDKSGKFIVTQGDSFAKDYTKVKYWY